MANKTFEQIETIPSFRGEPIDIRDDYWAIVDSYGKQVYWSSRPWVLPSEEQLEQDSAWCEKAIADGGGVAYAEYVNDVVELADGYAVLDEDNQWLFFERARQIKR